jgi:O-antigen ligase
MPRPISKSRVAVRGVTTDAAPRDALRPWLLAGVTALYVARPLLTSESAAETGDGLPFVMLALALAAVWTVRAALVRRATVRADWADLALGVFLLLHTASAVSALTTAAPRPALNMLWEWIGLGVGYFLLRQLLRGQREARAIVIVMIGLAASMSCYGLEQYFVSLPADRARYARDPEGALREAGVFAPPGSRQRVLFEQRINSTEPMGTFALANSLAGFLAPWLVATVGIGLSLRGAGRDKVRIALGLACAGLLMANCLLLTKSRSATLAVAGGIAVIILIVGWRRSVRATLLVTAGITAAIAALCAGAVAVGALDRQVLTEAGKSLFYRWQYWQAAWRMIRDYPWAGCGPGNFQGSYTRYKLPEASEVVADPHNFLMEIWATAGTPAALALLAVLGCVGWRLLRSWRSHDFADGKPADSEPSSRGSENFILVGGLAGFALALALSPLATVPLSLPAAAAGLAVAAAVVALAYPWMSQGRLLAALPAIAAVVLLVNLLAAGGIGYAGVAGSLWLLIALTLEEASRDRDLPRSAALGGMAMAAVLVGGCYATAYRPVLKCAEALGRAESDAGTLRAEADLHEAAAADPLSAEPWRKLAALEFARWQNEPSPATFEQFKAASDNALHRTPRSSSAWQLRGNISRQVYQTSRNPDDLRDAVKAYQQAVILYPNHPTGRALLATALAEASEPQAAAIEAAEALRLDGITPHADQKLSAELRNQLLRIQEMHGEAARRAEP